MVELAEVVHGQSQAQEVDQDPEEVQNIMTARTLAKKTGFNYFCMKVSRH